MYPKTVLKFLILIPQPHKLKGLEVGATTIPQLIVSTSKKKFMGMICFL